MGIRGAQRRAGGNDTYVVRRLRFGFSAVQVLHDEVGGRTWTDRWSVSVAGVPVGAYGERCEDREDAECPGEGEEGFAGDGAVGGQRALAEGEATQRVAMTVMGWCSAKPCSQPAWFGWAGRRSWSGSWGRPPCRSRPEWLRCCGWRGPDRPSAMSRRSRTPARGPLRPASRRGRCASGNRGRRRRRAGVRG